MKSAAAFNVLALSLAARGANATPIGKVLEMISDLQEKVIGEGVETQKVYEQFSEWCEERAKELMFAIKTEKNGVADLSAVIGEENAIIESLTTSVEDLSGKLSNAEADLKAATGIRAKEAADFGAGEKESTQIIDTLTRAIGLLEKEASKGGASMLQLQGATNLVTTLSALVQASAIDAADAQRLTALVQTAGSDDDDATSAPGVANYESHSGGIIGTLQGLLDKAQSQLEDARKKEQESIYNYEALKQSLNDEIKTTNRNLDKAHKGIAKSSEKKATAEGDLGATSKDLRADESTLAGVHHDCMTRASDFEAQTKSRNDELNALATAKKVIREATGAALGQVSLLQLQSEETSTTFQVVRFVRKLSQAQDSRALAQLASRMASVIRAGSKSGNDPFAKVKGLIRDMISKLEQEAEESANHKQYCDKEMSETKVKNGDKTAEIESLTTSIDQMSAQSAKLKEEVATLQRELADIASSQAESDRVRRAENRDYVANKAETEKALAGIQTALKVLNDYYGQADKAHASSDAAGGGIIDLLEVVESDLSKALAEMNQAEESASAEYQGQTKSNELDTTVKSQDVKYKMQESTDLDKAIAESSGDLANVQDELASVNQYWAQLKNECIEKATPYEEKVRRRNAEIAGLKEALEIVSGSAVLLQQSSAHQLRGVQPHVSLA